jgi:hypothetical protein
MTAGARGQLVEGRREFRYPILDVALWYGNGPSRSVEARRAVTLTTQFMEPISPPDSRLVRTK